MTTLPPLLLLALAALPQFQTTRDVPALEGERFTFGYLDEQRPLSAHPRLVAVRADAAQLSGLSLDGATLPGWTFVLHEETTTAGLRARVGELVQAGLEFVTPVFVTEEGLLQYPTSELILRLRADASVAEREAAVHAGGELLRADVSGLPRTYLLETGLRNGFEVRALARLLEQLPGVEYAEANRVHELERFLIPNDPSFPEQWGLDNTGQPGGVVGVIGVPDIDLDAPAAWDLTTGDASVLIGILDDGVQQDHPDLHQVPGMDFTGQGGGGGPVGTCDNHGTPVAGVATALLDNNLGGAGVAPGCRAISLRFATPATVPNCNGSSFFMTTWLTDALDHAQNNGIRITNFSNGLSPNTTISIAFDMTETAGVLHFAASGNAGSSNLSYPASLASVQAVGGLQRDGNLYGFSSFGPGQAFVAPGLEVFTTDRTGADGYDPGADYVGLSGTSFSAPFAAGVAALLVSMDPTLSNDEIVGTLACTAKDLGSPGLDTIFGHGLPDADDAILALGCSNAPAVVVRNAGINPNAYSATPPVLGEDLSLGVVDFAYTNVFVLGYAGPLNAPLASGQVLLISFATPQLFRIPLPGLPFAGLVLTLPCDPSLCGQTAYTQAVLYGGGPGFLLTNAVDLTIGSF